MTITPRDYHALTPAEQSEVDQIVASHLQPTGPDWDLPSGSGGHMPWLDDLIRDERPNYGFPEYARQWAEWADLAHTRWAGFTEQGRKDVRELGYEFVSARDQKFETIIQPGVEEFLTRTLGGIRGNGRHGGDCIAPTSGGQELIILSCRMPSFLQSPPRYSLLFEDCGEDEARYREECDRFDAETVEKRCSFVIIPGETPAEAAERVARKHIRPHYYFGQMCVFSGAGAPKPYGDHDAHYKNHPSSHPAHKLVMFRRGATFWAIPVCDECLWGDLDYRRPGRATGQHMGGGLVDDLASRGERAVIVDYWYDPETASLNGTDDGER